MIHRKKFLCVFTFFATLLTLSLLYSSPTFADTKIIETSFFGNLKDDGDGCGVYTILDFVLNILTIGVGILGVIGILVVGVMYLTARGNEEKTRKAKTRILEITIGLAAYAVIYAALTFLLPQFSPEIAVCQQATQADIDAQKAKEAAERAAVNDRSEKAKSSKTKISGKSSGSKNKIVNSAVTTSKEAAKAISDMGVKLASKGSGSKPTKAFVKAFEESGVKKAISKHGDSDHKKGKSCGAFVSTVVTSAGVDAKNMVKKHFADSIRNYMQKSKKWQQVKKPQAGDVAWKQYCNGKGCHGHIFVYVRYNGKLRTAEASKGDWYGKITNNKNPNYIFRYVGN